MSPLDGLFDLAELNWRHFQLPNDHHLVVAATGQVLPVGRKSNHVYCGQVPSLQIVLMLGLKSWRATSALHFFSRGLNCVVEGCVLLASQFPKAYP